MTNDEWSESPAFTAAMAAREPFTLARRLISRYTLELSTAVGFLRYHARDERNELAAESLRGVEEVRDFLNTLTDHLTYRSDQESQRAIDEWWDRQHEADR